MHERNEDGHPVDALTSITGELQECAVQLRAAADAARHMRDRLAAGVPVRQAVESSPRPLLTDRVSTQAARLLAEASRLRWALMSALRREGLTQDTIARTFGVSRQRVAAVYARRRKRQPVRPAPETP